MNCSIAKARAQAGPVRAVSVHTDPPRLAPANLQRQLVWQPVIVRIEKRDIAAEHYAYG